MRPSEAEGIADPLGQVVLRECAVDFDRGEREAIRLRAEVVGEEPVALEEVAESAGGIARLREEAPRGPSLLEDFASKRGRGQEPDSAATFGEKGFHEV